ncbi:MAG TPA: DUF6526 family protein [Thermoanaerobaculia bacterium]|nr:DUF6526 family protein [Thermoanaerobaculia bacterium]
MPDPVAQNYQSHRRFVPTYHYLTAGILVLNLLWALVRIYHGFHTGGRFAPLDGIISLFVAIALLLMFFHLRAFPLAVQDRVIRLEMRHRLAEVLPADLRPRIGELAPGQLIALRFASDEEMPELTRKVLDEKIASREAIKRLIKNWQADHLRA